MTLKGYVSVADNISHTARIVFPDRENNVTPELPVAPHVGDLVPGDRVAVIFFSSNKTDGLIIAKF